MPDLYPSSALIVVSASFHADVNLRKLYAWGAILVQLFSASLLEREYLSNHLHKGFPASVQKPGNCLFSKELCCLSLAVSPFMSPRKAEPRETKASIPESIIKVSKALCHVTVDISWLYPPFSSSVMASQLYLPPSCPWEFH